MTEKKKVGRPRTTVDPPKGMRQKAGLQAADTRASFVVNEDLWKELKDYQNTSIYRSMKELMDEMIKAWLKDHK